MNFQEFLARIINLDYQQRAAPMASMTFEQHFIAWIVNLDHQQTATLVREFNASNNHPPTAVNTFPMPSFAYASPPPIPCQILIPIPCQIPIPIPSYPWVTQMAYTTQIPRANAAQNLPTPYAAAFNMMNPFHGQMDTTTENTFPLHNPPRNYPIVMEEADPERPTVDATALIHPLVREEDTPLLNNTRNTLTTAVPTAPIHPAFPHPTAPIPNARNVPAAAAASRNTAAASRNTTAAEESNITCPHCTWTAPDYASLNRHHRANHKDLMMKCSLCDYTTGQAFNLTRHR